jgi:uncharacterized protein YgiM (DUF1202 family)
MLSIHYLQSISRTMGTSDLGKELFPRLFDCEGMCHDAYLYASTGLWEEAGEMFQSFVRKNSRDVKSCFNLAVAREVVNDRDGAVNYCQKAIDLNPDPRYVDFLQYLKKTPRNQVSRQIPGSPISPEKDFSGTAKESMYVKTDSSIVFRDPSDRAPAVDAIPRGAQVSILKQLGAWCHVRTKKGKEGWMISNTLASSSEDALRRLSSVNQPGDSSNSQADSETKPDSADDSEKPLQRMKVKNTGASVAVRSEPSLLSDVIHQFQPGKIVKVIGKARGNWLQVVTPAGTGYIISLYLEETGDSSKENQGKQPKE